MSISLKPSYWGDPSWKFLYCIASAYPESQPTKDHKTHAAGLFNALQMLLPCLDCRSNYVELIYKFPVEDAVHSRQALLEWLNNIHNQVNEEIGKDHIPLEDILKEMEEHTIRSDTKQKDDTFYIVRSYDNINGRRQEKPKRILTRVEGSRSSNVNGRIYKRDDGFTIHGSNRGQRSASAYLTERNIVRNRGSGGPFNATQSILPRSGCGCSGRSK